jgi:hypothetical protein
LISYCERLSKNHYLLLFPFIIELIYCILSLAAVPPFFISLIAFPAVFIFPGLMLLIFFGRGLIAEDLQLFVEGFFVSTLYLVIITGSMLALDIALNSLNYSIITLVFVSILMALIFIRKIHLQMPKTLHKTSIFYFTIIIFSFLILFYFFNATPRLFTPDETSYLSDIRALTLKSEITFWGTSPTVQSFLNSRAFWIFSGAGFLTSTSLQQTQIGLFGCMFLPMIALTASLLIPKEFKNRCFLQIIAIILVAASPLLDEFSGFILNDLAISFYMLFAVLLFIKSFKVNNCGKASISISGLILSGLSVFVGFLIKPNILYIIPLILILIGFIIKNKLYKTGKYKALLLLTVTPIIIYEFVFDIPYLLTVWLKLGSEQIRDAVWAFTKPFLSFGSPAETFVGWVVPTAWKPTTVFSYDYVGFSNYLYRFLSPEALTLLFAAVGLVLPLILLIKEVRSNLQLKLLTIFISLTLVFLFFTFLSGVNFEDLNRYSLFIYPIITVLSIITFYTAFTQNKTVTLIALTMPALILLQMNLSLCLSRNGVSIGYGLPKLDWTGTLLMLQLLAYLAIVVLLNVKTFQTKIFKIRTQKLAMPSLLFTAFIVIILIANIGFSTIFIGQSQNFTDTGLNNLDNYFSQQAPSYILSNSYIYLRDFVNDTVYTNNNLIPCPITIGELNEFISKGYNGTRIVAIENPAITNYEYANQYKDELVQGNYIIPNLTTNHGILPQTSNDTQTIINLTVKENQTQFIDGSSNQNTGVHSNLTYQEDQQGIASLDFNGKNGYAEYALDNSQNITNQLTMRTWFRTSTSQNSTFILEQGNPYNYGIYLTQNSKILSFYVRLSTDDVVIASCSGTYDDNLMHDVVGTFDGQTAKLYIDGTLKASTQTKTNDEIMQTEKPFWIGTWAKKCYFQGAIYAAQIYNTTLTSQEIASEYLGENTAYAKPIYKQNQTNNKLVIYQIEGPINLHKSDSNIKISNVQIDSKNISKPVIKIDVNTPESTNLTMILSTIRFSKLISTTVNSGSSTLDFAFEYQLSDGKNYGYYLLDHCNIQVIDDTGNILYDNTLTNSRLSSNTLILYIFLLTAILTTYLATSIRYGKVHET